MKYSKEKVEEICKYVSLGMTNESAAICSDINQNTFYEWMKKSEFCEALKKAKEKNEASNLAIIHRAKHKTWQAAAWLLERQHKDKYALLQKLEHTGPNGTPIRHTIDFDSQGQKKVEELVKKLDAYLRARKDNSD